MRLEAITVCVDYSDFLEETLPFVLPHVDDLVVVTTPEDRRTRGVCHKAGVRCLPTHCFYQWDEPFNKARGINHGLANLRLSDWVLHLDADIALPPRTRWLMSCAMLDERKLYGIDRVNVVGREAWDAYRRLPDPQYVSSCRMEPPNGHEWGSRVLHVGYGGYCPIGYFQLWHPRGSEIDRYPDTCVGTAERTDLLHALQWDRPDRVLLPEVVGLHLMTRGGREQGANWQGRKSPEFTAAEAPFRPAQAHHHPPRPVRPPAPPHHPPHHPPPYSC